jgi:NTP pyrophosphatase (non-canonical NTP hydrolase)
MSDESTTVSQLRELVAEFVRQRNWEQFHTPKNLAMALAIEAAELMEHFQWLTSDESENFSSDSARVSAAGEELADVICYALAMANSLGLDVADAMRAKMAKNIKKYPADEFQGRYRAD